MAQLTVYIDDETRLRIEVAARRADVSVSQWVKQRLTSALQTEWPTGYFEMFGTLPDGELERPPQGRFADEASREPL